MNKKLIFGSLFSVIILLLLPSVTSIEYNTSEKANEEYIVGYIQKMNIEELKETILNSEISDKDIIEFINDKISNPAHRGIICKIFHLIKKLFRLIINLLLLPLRLFLLPLKIILFPLKLICKLICFPFKMACCLLKRIFSDRKL